MTRNKLIKNTRARISKTLKRLSTNETYKGKKGNNLVNIIGCTPQAYKNMKTNGEITHLTCMAHARRYFDKALKNDKKRAKYVLTLMQRLYEMERKARECEISFETRYRYRQLYAKPILQELENWLIENQYQTTPQSSIGQAIAYTKISGQSLKRTLMTENMKLIITLWRMPFVHWL